MTTSGDTYGILKKMTTHTFTYKYTPNSAPEQDCGKTPAKYRIMVEANKSDSWYDEGTGHTIEAVREWNERFGVHVNHEPTVDNNATNALRIALLDEELGELGAALRDRNPVAALDALTDLQYILDGTYLALGLGHLKRAAFDEVHRSNMSKLGGDGRPILRGDGKILKGPNYSKPNLEQFFK